ncbi:MAG: hypothetical protein Q7S40_17175 [Opitutaceae bacterium]|nr:hypothetical protein [Opitutaceae bacterium]
MNNTRYDTLISSMDRSIELFSEIRTPDAVSVAAFDTLKQARALIAHALENERRATSPERAVLAAGF